MSMHKEEEDEETDDEHTPFALRFDDECPVRNHAGQGMGTLRARRLWRS
jgi:hypothetical protein